MTNNAFNLSQSDWSTIFTLINKTSSSQSSIPTFYQTFINTGLRHNYFSPELQAKISEFHEENKNKDHKRISEQWSQNFNNDFNLKDHFNIFLLSNDDDHQKFLVEFIEKKIGKEETFYTLNKFFLDDNNASKFDVLRKNWRELLEKYKFPINSDTVKRIVQGSTFQAVHEHSSTADLVLNFKMLVLDHLYNPNTKSLEDYIVKYSKDALFEKRAFGYLEKKNIQLKISPELIDTILFVRKEVLIYKIDLNPEYLLKKHTLTRNNSEIICWGFIGYIHKILEQPLLSSNTFNIQLKCENTLDYERIKKTVTENIINLDKVVEFIKENKFNAVEMTNFLTQNIEKILMKEALDSTLREKPSQKKLKI